MSEKAKAMTNLVVMAVLTLNAALTLSGKNPIPFDENAFTEVAAQIIAAASILWAWWKNNNLSEAAIDAQLYLDELKEDYGLEFDDEADEEIAEEVGELTDEEVHEYE